MSTRREIFLISPWAIPIPDMSKRSRDIDRQKARLQAEGQIEPIALLSGGDPDLDSWAYAREQIAAMRQLGWKDCLITYNPATMTDCTGTDSCNCVPCMSAPR